MRAPPAGPGPHPDSPRSAAGRPQVGKGVGLAEPVAEVTVDAQCLFQVPGRARIVPGQPHTSPGCQGVGLAEPVAEVPVDAQCLLQVPGRARIVPGEPPHEPQGR